MLSIFDLVTSDQIVAYWETRDESQEEYIGDILFPPDQKLGLDLKWIKGSKGLPIVLKPSAYDVAAVKRNRIGFDKIYLQMPFFKESMMIDELLRQELNMVLETGNQAYIDAVMNRVFDDDMQLLRGAKAQRERMKFMLITTGMISISANGQNYDYDYQLEEEQFVEATIPWNNFEADVAQEIREWQDDAEERTGVRPTRALCSRKTFGYLTRNILIRNAINGHADNVSVSDTAVKQYLASELELSIEIISKKYIAEDGSTEVFMPDNLFILLPPNQLGIGWFGTTPEQSDLMTGTAANVTITDVGVAVTTSKTVDPVNVDTKVSMINLPSFESGDQIVIAEVVPAA